MVTPKPCPRCAGNMMLEEFPGEAEFVCIQCGHRLAAPEFRRPNYVVVPTKKAA